MNLLTPYTLRGVTLPNRIVVSPMCQYCATDGFADDWHLVHLGSRAVGGAGLVFVEATAVTPEGRITPGDMGLWDDAHTEPLARIARFVSRMGSVPAIQLAHAGRKASCLPPFKGGARITDPAQGGWTPIAPSPIPFVETDPPPAELDEAGITRIVDAWVAAARRAIEAGFRIIEIHNAHGYLLHEFLSPLSNRRTDQYGGSLENRMRLSLRVASAVRRVLPDSMPLFVRISATDWAEGGWDLDQSIELAKCLKQIGVDLMDCSSGALIRTAKIPFGRGFQVPFAAAIREKAGIPTGAVGMITEPNEANEIVTSGKADLVFLAREMLREPYWALKAEAALGAEPHWQIQYGYAAKIFPPKS
ncbi:MAG: NADH:flavin oxidoreductase/NADH oxidase [Acidobacteriia bacterium]|nr:NADH:flavin oxidoreductase/NADH oxidase [Terriglobia bacterium]